MWALKIEEGSVAGAGSLNWFVQSWEASPKLQLLIPTVLDGLVAGLSVQHDIITEARDSRQRCHVQPLSNPPLKNS